MRVLLFISRWIDAFNRAMGKVASWACLILIGLVAVDVLRRYIFQQTDTWIIELEWHLFALIFLFGAATTLIDDGHVRVDLFYENMASTDRANVNLIGHLIFLVPWSIVMAWLCFFYAWDSFLIQEGSPNPNGLPARYIIKSAMALCFSMLALQAISQLIKIVDQKRTET